MTPQAVSTENVLCELKDVSHSFPQPNGQPLCVLEDIQFAIRPREVVALLGPSGCGKSTILRILAGLIRPTTGSVHYAGQTLLGINPGVGIVFQSFALYPWLTVMENIEVVLKAAQLPDSEVRRRALGAVRKVGLEGFEEAYPRELSGGMKQRVGMARALSVEPEVLFMDEPFSHVDALTAEGLRAEVMDIWGAGKDHPSSVLLVSHDIREVVYMADRVIVLGAHPGRIRTQLAIDLPRPRDYRSPAFVKLVDHLYELIVGHEMPDPTVSELESPAHGPEPLPAATTNDVQGLLEYLDARQGRDDIFRIAQETHQQFGHVITVVKAAEMLDFVDTPKQQVVLTADGRRFVAGTPRERQVIWGERVEKLGLFREVKNFLTKEGWSEEERVIELIQQIMPGEKSEEIFDTMVRWARLGGVFAFDEDSHILSLADRDSDSSIG